MCDYVYLLLSFLFLLLLGFISWLTPWYMYVCMLILHVHLRLLPNKKTINKQFLKKQCGRRILIFKLIKK